MSQHDAGQPGDGLRIVHDNDDVRIVERDGRTSVTVHLASKDDGKPFRVHYWRSTQEVQDANGKFVCRTTDPEMAQHICKLLIAFTRIEARKAAGA